MLDLSKLKNRTVLLKLKEYDGPNEYIHRLRMDALRGKVLLTLTQVAYINDNYTTEPIEIGKVVDITSFFGEQLQEKWELKHTPERILVEMLLAESEKAYHIKGKLYKNQKKSELYFIPKTQLNSDLFEDEVIDIDVDFERLNNMSTLGRKLFKHQEGAVKFLLRKKKGILADDMGLGKTASSIVASIEVDAQKVLVVCPSNAKVNWKREILNYGVLDDDINIISGKNWVSNGKYTIINYDILKNFHTLVDGRKRYEDGEINRSLVEENFDLVILDECFTYNTMVTTEMGKLPIGKIVDDDMDVKILSYNLETNKLEYKKINRWVSKKTKNTLLRIKLHNDIFIDCTPNHKIYVKNRGYVKAEEIRENDDLCYLSERINEKTNVQGGSVLFENVCEQRHGDEKKIGRESESESHGKPKDNCMRSMWGRKKGGTILNPKILFNKLFSQVESDTGRYIGKDKKEFTERKAFTNIERYAQKTPTHCETNIGKNENKQPNDEPRNSGKNETIIKRSNIFKSWWEWEINKTTKDNTRTIRWGGKRVDNGISNKNKGSMGRIPILTKLLQSRYWKSINKTSYRNRWEQSQDQEMEILGQEENSCVRTFRVESVTVLERGSGQEPQYDNRGYTKVYNLEIDDNHNYFSNGVLVSNCHMVKNQKSQRTKIINEVSENIDRRWLLTGTPIANRPMDYYNLLFLCDSPITSNWQYFAFRYCEAKKFYKRTKNGGSRQIWLTDGSSNLEELHNRTKKYILRRMKEDHLDLPPKIVAPYYLEMDDMKAYNSVFDEYLEWAKSEGRSLGTGRHMVELGILRKFISLKKVEHSIEIAQQAMDQGKKVIIFTCFTDSFNALMSHFGKLAVGHNGKMNGNQKQSSIDNFQENDKVKVFVGNLVSAGTAITLTAAEVVIMNDLDFVPSNHAQAEDRAYRIGATKTVNVYYPIYEGTIDEMMYGMLQKKRQIINTIMGEDHEEVNISEDFINQITLS